MTAANLPSAGDIVAAGRLRDVLAAAELYDRKLPPTRRDRGLPDRLRIVYLVARVGLGEGERLLLAQARHLAALGADVTVLTRAHPDDTDADYRERRSSTRARLRPVPYGEAMTEAVPPCDLIVAGCWEFVMPARMLGFAPVVLFEQGELQVLGDVPEHIRAVVASSLRAASVTFALGENVQASLRDEYGVDALAAPGVVDLGLFHPGRPRRTASEEHRAGVVCSGCEALDGDRMADARRVAAGLAESHADHGIVWVSQLREPAMAPGRAGQAPAAASNLARALRSARAFLSATDRAAFDVAPLQAMASGTPVVSTAHPGVLSYATDGLNALLVPVGDVDGLLAAVRRVLDDGELAARLATAGLETAAAHGWAVVGPQLLGRYAEVVSAAPHAPPLGGFTVHLGGLRFARPGDAARLRARLGACTTREVALPVSQPAFGAYRAVRWRVIARRDEGEEGITRVYLPARSERPLDDAPAQGSLDLLREGRAKEALEGFVERCQRGTREEQAVLGRWVVLCMLAAGRARDAAEVAVAFANDFPVQPDYIVLAVACTAAARRPVDVAGPLERVRLLGVGARYDEWFEDPCSLLTEQLDASA